MSHMNFKISIKIAELEDLPKIQSLFVDTIENICKNEYSPEQIEAWTSSVNNIEVWEKRITEQYFITAIYKDQIVGFASLKNNDYLDLLYVHKDYQRKGIADQLYSDIENTAIKAGASSLTADVSKSAKPFFIKKGFSIQKKQKNIIQNTEIINYKMENRVSRRKFIQAGGIAALGLMLPLSSELLTAREHNIKAIAFDGFPIFDPRPVFQSAIELFPEKGKDLIEVWTSKQFSYQWLRTAGNRYKNFREVTEDALDFASVKIGLNITSNQKNIIMNKYNSLNIWDDVIPALTSLKNMNLKLGFLSNMTFEMLHQGIQNSNTSDYFDFVISTDAKKTYKPSPDAYQMGIDTLKMTKNEILFVAFAGWDMAGAKWFGYPTYWVNRLGSPPEMLDAEPDGTGSNLNDLLKFVRRYNKK